MDELSKDDSVASEWAYRACIECSQVWAGVMTCPRCGAPGEPLSHEPEEETSDEPGN